MHGTSQGSAHPESSSTIRNTGASTASVTIAQDIDDAWDAIVAGMVAAVAAQEAAEAAAGVDVPADALADLLEAQPSGARCFSLPLAAGASNRIPVWHSRRYWLELVEHVLTHTERGRDALRRRGIAATTCLAAAAAHAEHAESSTGRRVSASINVMQARSGLSRDMFKRARRVLKDLELGVEQARGKRLNRLERAAAAQVYAQAHGELPRRQQGGAASVWALSAPQWAVEVMPEAKPARKPARRRAARTSTGPARTRTAPRRSASSAPQSPSGCSSSFSSFGLNSLTRDERAGEDGSSRPLNLQRAAAQLVERIPALRGRIGVDDRNGRRRGHVGVVCELLVTAGIDTDRWTGTDIASELNRAAALRGWTWPTVEKMTSPGGLVAWRLAQIDWSVPSPTEIAVRRHQGRAENPSDAAYRLITTRRAASVAAQASTAPPASAEHRRAVLAQITAELGERRSTRKAGDVSSSQFKAHK